MEILRERLRREIGEAVEAWRCRAIDAGMAAARARGWTVESVRLSGVKGGPTLLDSLHGVIEVVVAGRSAAAPPKARDEPAL